MNARAELKAVEYVRPTAGQFALANGHALNLAEHCYRAANQTEDSAARLTNERAAILDLHEAARLLGYDIVPARPRHG